MIPLPTKLTARLQYKVAALTNTVLLVGLAYWLATLSWKLFPVDPPQATTPSVSSVSQSSPTPSTRAPQQAATINNASLFGEVDRTPAPAPQPVIAPVTPLNLTLKGVFASQGTPRAIIASNNRQDNVYAIGDMLPGNAQLTEIFSDRVILLRNSTKETLYLPREQINTSTDETLRTLPQGESSRPFTPLNTSISNNPGRYPSPRPLNANQYTATQSSTSNSYSNAPVDATEIRDAFMNNPSSLLKYGRISPAQQGGRQIGYRIYEGQMLGQLARYGIQAGDIITSVNNIPLNGSQSIGQLMNIVARSSNVRVELLRNGAPITKNFRLR